ncbi:response regulator [Candidatus Albibeggiatoa sp. nov. NOAA]|uniref:response regulator n=1 Tax=Candidatus Albibeggiatoa sp. nov. NOAA TaxID=3162724 RepID=UPI0032F4D080|nr:response regulator [Thiotrichaceae bacterium]
MQIILIVDDVPPSVDVLRNFLSAHGFGVRRTINGQKAIELASQIKPDIILMDSMMPVMHGWEATAILKAREDTKHIPIITIGEGMEEHQEKALAAGCDDLLVKPIKLPELLEKINNLLSQKRKQDA